MREDGMAKEHWVDSLSKAVARGVSRKEFFKLVGTIAVGLFVGDARPAAADEPCGPSNCSTCCATIIGFGGIPFTACLPGGGGTKDRCGGGGEACHPCAADEICSNQGCVKACSPERCADGCCVSAGPLGVACLRVPLQSNSQCGLGGETCQPCGPDESCSSGK